MENLEIEYIPIIVAGYETYPKTHEELAVSLTIKRDAILKKDSKANIELYKNAIIWLIQYPNPKYTIPKLKEPFFFRIGHQNKKRFIIQVWERKPDFISSFHSILNKGED